MEMHQARYFLAVCETENFTRASEACNVAQPSLSKAIRKLEEELGGALFYRDRHRSLLTELGRRMHPHLKAMIEASEAAWSDAQGLQDEATTKIRLGVMSTIAPTQMIGFLSRLRETLPELDLEISEAKATDLVTRIQDDALDVALLALPGFPDGLRALPLYAERYTIAFPVGHVFAQENAVPVASLDGVDYLKRVHCEFVEHYEALGDMPALGVNVRYSSEREDWVQAMVAAGLGCSIMPEFLPVLAGIGTRPLIEPEVSRMISLVTVAGRPFSPALARMLRVAERYEWPGRV